MLIPQLHAQEDNGTVPSTSSPDLTIPRTPGCYSDEDGPEEPESETYIHSSPLPSDSEVPRTPGGILDDKEPLLWQPTTQDPPLKRQRAPSTPKTPVTPRKAKRNQKGRVIYSPSIAPMFQNLLHVYNVFNFYMIIIVI